MAVNLNLLPPELAVSKSLGKFLKTVKALGVIGVAAFLVFGVGIGAFFIVSTISLNRINANIKVLKNQVSAQQKSEQQVILLKDRIAKIASIQSIPDSLSNLTATEPFLIDLSGSMSVNQMAVSPTSVSLSLNLKTNSDLSTFLESLQTSDVFKTVSLTTFNFSPSIGYSVEVSAVKK